MTRHLSVHRLLWLGGIAVLIGFWILSPVGSPSDAHNYWQVDLNDPYRMRWADPDSFVYSPAFAQAIYPLTLLPFEVFYKLIQGLNIIALGWLVGPVWGAASLLTPPVQSELYTNNIHFLLAVMVIAGFSRPWLWTFALVTKVTPGVGLLWFVARREWRPLLVAIMATVVLIGLSAVLLPGAWGEWVGLLTESSTVVVGNFTVVQIPVFVRLPIAAGVVVISAWNGWRWGVALGALFALPAIWMNALVMLLAIPRLTGARARFDWRRLVGTIQERRRADQHEADLVGEEARQP